MTDLRGLPEAISGQQEGGCCDSAPLAWHCGDLAILLSKEARAVWAAATCGYDMEIDPKYCDVICQRHIDFSGKPVILESTGETFEQVKVKRLAVAA